MQSAGHRGRGMMAAPKYVYFFGRGRAEGSAKMKDLLGGKGSNLAEMTTLKIPVPPGFTITTTACVESMKRQGKFPPGPGDRRSSPRRGSGGAWRRGRARAGEEKKSQGASHPMTRLRHHRRGAGTQAPFIRARARGAYCYRSKDG